MTEGTTNACFFCDPDGSRILYSSEHFYAILGLGPIIEGYVILVAKQHVRSMLDLPVRMRRSYESEKNRLKDIIARAYGPPIITEHGRIQACLAEDEEVRDNLCFHAHQLFFPISLDLRSLSKEGPFTKIFEGASLFDLNVGSLGDEEYLLFEDAQGMVTVHTVRGKCPRQFMRYLVARSIGKAELSNWATYPEWDKIARAKSHYQTFLVDSLDIDVSSARDADRLEMEQL